MLGGLPRSGHRDIVEDRIVFRGETFGSDGLEQVEPERFGELEIPGDRREMLVFGDPDFDPCIDRSTLTRVRQAVQHPGQPVGESVIQSRHPEARPEIAIQAQVGVPDQLLEQLRTGVLDIAVLYAPKLLPDFRVELLVEEQLVLVRTTDKDGEPVGSKDYVYVDWGPLFAAQHGASSSAFGEPGLMVGLGPLGLNYILRAGGMGYFRRGAAAPHIEAGQLEVVEGAPEFTYPACGLSGSKRGASRRAGGAARPEASCEMIVPPRRSHVAGRGWIATD
ncbi:MAG: hypothetical protein E5Y07_31570 [Mesorhizobium sp.]|nr:MAG: hypothetical protein E5Y07_31570 [Mesorhizobium sp.]